MPQAPALADADPNLTTLQNAFAECYVANGCGSARKAALDAGYSEASAGNVGPKLLRDERVLARIHSLTLHALAASAPIALAVQNRLMLTAKSEFVRQKASADILDRTGFKPVDRHQHLVAGSVTVSIDLGGD